MKKTVSLLLALLLLFAVSGSAFAADASEKQAVVKLLEFAQEYAAENIDYESTALNATADWIELNRVQHGLQPSEAYKTYIEKAVAANYDTMRIADAARIAIVLQADGFDLKNIGGRDLAAKLTAYDYSKESNVFYLTYPLLAMNFKENSDFPEDTKQLILQKLLDGQMLGAGDSCGAFSYTVDHPTYADLDSTAMILPALAPYARENPEVQKAIDLAVQYLFKNQKENGMVNNSYTTAQVVLALCSVSANPTEAKFAKGGIHPVQALLKHLDTALEDGRIMEINQMTQAFVALERFQEGNAGYFRNTLAKTDTAGKNDHTAEKESDGKGAQGEAEKEQSKHEKTTAAEKNVEIPKTGAKADLAPLMMTAAALGVAVTVLRKKVV